MKKKIDDTVATEKPAKKLTAEQKAKAKEKLAKKRAALKEKKRLAREKKAARLEKKRAAKKAVREAKKAKKLARLEKKRVRILKAKELKRARLEKKRAKLAAQKAKAKELKAKAKAKAKELKAKQTAKTKEPKVKDKPAKVAVEKVDLKNIAVKDMTKELTKRLKTFVKVLADNKSDATVREELAKSLEKDGIKVTADNGNIAAALLITAATHATAAKQPAVKHAAIAAEQPKENAQPEAAAKEPPVEAEATEVPIGDTYGNEPTDEELANIEAEQEAEEEEEEEEIDTRSDVDDDQADFRREFFGNSENTEDFE